MTATVVGDELRALLDEPGREVAVLDVRAPAARAGGHIALSSGLPLHDLEHRVRQVVPRLDTTVVLVSEPELDERAARILARLGYTDVVVVQDGLAGWTSAGGRLYTGTNVRSKTLGEWIEKHFGTETVDAETVLRWRAEGTDVVVLDSRPHSEYLHHHIPGGFDTGGGSELAYRGLQRITDPETTVVVNCAGRTRGIVGAQSLINTGIPNRVYSLHNGLPAWGWAGGGIETGPGTALDAPADVPAYLIDWAATTLGTLGVQVVDETSALPTTADARTTYLIDIRTPEEFAAGTLPGARHVQGGQLVQAADEHLAVIGARVVLADTPDLVRAASTAQWLHYLHRGPIEVTAIRPENASPPQPQSHTLPEVPEISGAELARELESGSPPTVFDLRSAREYELGHLPGSIHARREHLRDAARGHGPIVLIGGDPLDSTTDVGVDLQSGSTAGYRPHFAASDLLETGHDVRVVTNGPSSVPADPTASDPRYTGEIADRVGPPPFGPARDAWYRDYFDWEYALLAHSEGDRDFDFQTEAP
jgi:rhodanese-related sulfurtransferase